MKNCLIIFSLFSLIFLYTACQPGTQQNTDETNVADTAFSAGSFGYDLEFMEKYKKPLVLKSSDMAQILLVPDFQGRILTSTAKGLSGNSYGWVNYELISSGSFIPHMNPFGGEDRFWIGPEGGQYSIFFKPGTEFTYENWNTPGCIDTAAFDLVSNSETQAVFHKEIELQNFTGTEFKLDINRKIDIFSNDQIENQLGISIGDSLYCVGFQSENIMKNISGFDFTKDKGLLSIWVLGMFTPSDGITIVIPIKTDDTDSVAINSAYFGAVGPDRLIIQDSIVYFRGDGKFRSKIGIPPEHTKSIAGSYDAIKKILTIVEYTFENDDCYVNSLWEHHEFPYKGDVINSYNDGSMDNGDQLGPFYEIETSSAAKELKNEESVVHVHKTYHFEGDPVQINEISKKLLGVGIEEIETAFK